MVITLFILNFKRDSIKFFAPFVVGFLICQRSLSRCALKFAQTWPYQFEQTKTVAITLIGCHLLQNARSRKAEGSTSDENKAADEQESTEDTTDGKAQAAAKAGEGTRPPFSVIYSSLQM